MAEQPFFLRDFAAALGVKINTLAAYRTRGHIPPEDGRWDGRPYWFPATVRAHLAVRRGSNDVVAREYHSAVAMTISAHPDWTIAQVARELGITHKSASKHLNGRCGCTTKARRSETK